METTPTEIVATVAETLPYAEYLETLIEYQNLQTGFLLFFVVVLLCYFAYKFFRIFF